MLFATPWLVFTVLGCFGIATLATIEKKKFSHRIATSVPFFLFVGSTGQEVIFRWGIFAVGAYFAMPLVTTTIISALVYYAAHFTGFFLYTVNARYMRSHPSFHLLIVFASIGFPVMYALYPSLLWASVAHIAFNYFVFGYRYI